jgi:hypothetical protein
MKTQEHKMFRALAFTLVIVLNFFASLSFASAENKLDICITGARGIDSNSLERASSLNFDPHEYRYYQAADISCKDVRKIEVGLETAVLTLSIGATISTATGVGVPVSAGLEISAAGFSYIDFLVGGIDCKEDRAEFVKKVKAAVCEAFADNPKFVCDPALLQVSDANPSDLACKVTPLSL